MSDDKTRILSSDEAARLAALLEPAEDKTRLLSAKEAAEILGGSTAPAPKAAASTEDRTPKFIGSKIVFFCANGHKITVDRSLAGKHGKCQGMEKQGCGVPFVIPIPPDFKPAPKPASADGKRAKAGPVAGVAAPRDAAPAVDVGANQPAMEEAFSLGSPLVVEESPPAPGAFPIFVAEEPAAAGPPIDLGGDFGPKVSTFDIDQLDHPTAQLVARLWLVKKEHGGVIEVLLSGGSVIVPNYFDPRLSCGSHALFAADTGDGNYTLTVVAWDHIQKVVLRQVPGLPEGMFED